MGVQKTDRNAIDCPNGRVPEAELYAAFMRMYNKLKRNTGVVLLPAIKQMEELRDGDPKGQSRYAGREQAIALASEQSYNISKLQTAGLLDTDACTAKFNEINARLAELRAERRRLLENEDIDDAIDALQQTVDLIRHGPERPDGIRRGTVPQPGGADRRGVSRPASASGCREA